MNKVKMPALRVVSEDGLANNIMIYDDQGRHVTNVRGLTIHADADSGIVHGEFDMLFVGADIRLPPNSVTLRWSIAQIVRDRLRRWWNRVRRAVTA
jgi:hypothetical protein